MNSILLGFVKIDLCDIGQKINVPVVPSLPL